MRGVPTINWSERRRLVVDPPEYNSDGTVTFRVRYVPEGMESVNLSMADLYGPKGEPPPNRHERRQEASRKHQRAALHGAGDQKRIAVERRGE